MLKNNSAIKERVINAIGEEQIKVLKSRQKIVSSCEVKAVMAPYTDLEK